MTAREEAIQTYVNLHRYAGAMEILTSLQRGAGTLACLILSRAGCYLLYGDAGIRPGASTQMFDPDVPQDEWRQAA